MEGESRDAEKDLNLFEIWPVCNSEDLSFIRRCDVMHSWNWFLFWMQSFPSLSATQCPNLLFYQQLYKRLYYLSTPWPQNLQGNTLCSGLTCVFFACSYPRTNTTMEVWTIIPRRHYKNEQKSAKQDKDYVIRLPLFPKYSETLYIVNGFQSEIWVNVAILDKSGEAEAQGKNC